MNKDMKEAFSAWHNARLPEGYEGSPENHGEQQAFQAAWEIQQKRVEARLIDLHRAGTEVHRLGACTGSQWTHLSIALMLAKSLLTKKEHHEN